MTPTTPPPTFRIRVLGPLRIERDGTEVDLGGPKPRLLLGVLLTRMDDLVTNERLIDDLWGEEPPATAKKAVQVHVSNLRRSLGESFPLRTAPGGYVLQSAGIEVDSVVFDEQVAQATALLRTDPHTASEILRDAAARWTGPAYADLAGEDALRAEVARLNELRLQATSRRLDAELRLGRHADVVGELETLATDHPYHERFRALHMLALYRSGRQTEALRAFERTRSTLVDELGIDPSPELRELHQQILEQSSDLDLDDAGSGERYAFLATDLENSTAIWEIEPDLMEPALARHDQIIGDAVARNAGKVFQVTGDGFYAVFARASDAIDAAVEAQRALSDESWATSRPLEVRMAVDEGQATPRGDDYFGPVMNRVSRIMSSGHGQQLLIPAELVDSSSVPTVSLGTADYKGVGRLEVAQVVIDGLPTEFPELRTERTPGSTTRQGFSHAIRGYEVRERLGEGAHGIVYRAYQSSVGREVAVKVIRPDFANEPEFIRRFEAEAQYVAQLEHPHIVPLYDYWRDPEGAYLAMQWMRGGSLARSLERAAWKPPAALHLLDQIGGAMDYAHRQGVIHRDIKPANVLLDDEGNAFLSDFGIAAQHLDAVGSADASSVAYLAPEELAGDPAGSAADMYCLALLTYEMLTGDRPAFGAQPAPVADAAPGLPAALDAVLAKATEAQPSERYGRVGDYLRALRQAFGADVVTTERPRSDIEIRNPFKGLRAFTETDAQDYFGRDALVEDLIAEVASHPLTAVVGPSGCGKSSLVKAGLLPAVRRGALGIPGDALVTEMFPGSFPFEELEAALLRVAAHHPPGLLADLTHDERGLLRVAKQILPDDDSELVLVIDQFEEIFSLTTDDEVRRSFLDNLVTIGSDERRRVRVVITMRADFFDRPLAHAEFGSLMREGLVPVAMPTEPELTLAIAEPVRRAGLEVEPGLVPAIIRDVADEPGALPLLQYAMTELVDGREGTLLTGEAYTRTGGVVGALARRAEEIHDGLAPGAKDAAREVFLRLVAVDNDGNDTRRRVRRTELDNLGLSDAALAAVLDAYGSFRLLSFDHDPVTRGPTVEVAHEALIREWPRYRDWVDAKREDLLLERRLEAATAEWENSGRDESYLLGGGRLEQYQEWAGSSDLRLTTAERELLDHSGDAADDERESERRRVRRLRRMVAGIGVALIVALVAGGFAFVQQERADDEAARATDAAAEAETQARLAAAAADDAELATLISRSAAVAIEDPQVAMLLALEARRRAPGPDTDRALLGALASSQLSSSVSLIDDPADPCVPGENLSLISADGLTEFKTLGDTLLSKDLVTGTVTEHGTAPAPCTFWFGDEDLNVRWAGDVAGSRWWFGPFDGSGAGVGGWSTRLDAPGPGILGTRSFAGNRLVFGNFVNGRITLSLVDPSTAEVVATIEGLDVGPWRPNTRSPNGEMIATSILRGYGTLVNAEVIVLDAETGEERHRVPMFSPAQKLTFDMVTNELLAATVDGSLVTIDLETGEVIAEVPTSATSEFLALGVRPDGLVVAVSAGRIELLGRRLGPTGTSVSIGNVDEARVRPDGSVLAVNHHDHTAEVFDLGITPLVEQSWEVDPLAVVEFAGGQAGVVEPDGRTVLVDLTTGERSAVDLRAPGGEPFPALAVFPEEESVLAFGGGETSMARWVDGEMVDRVELRAGVGAFSFFPGVTAASVLAPGPGFAGHGAAVSFSHDFGNEIYLLETTPDRLGATLVKEVSRAISAYPTGDGGVHVMDEFGRLRTFDGSGRLLGEIATDRRWLTAVDGDETSGKFAFGGLSGAVIVEPASGEVDVIPGVGNVTSVGFLRHGELLVIVGDDGSVRLWDVEQRDSLLLFKGSGGASASPPWYDESTDSLWVATSGRLVRFPLDPEQWVERACEIVGRDFTQEEWERYVPGDEPLESACA